MGLPLYLNQTFPKELQLPEHMNYKEYQYIRQVLKRNKAIDGLGLAILRYLKEIIEE